MKFKIWFEGNFPKPITMHGQQVSSDEEANKLQYQYWQNKGYTPEQIKQINSSADTYLDSGLQRRKPIHIPAKKYSDFVKILMDLQLPDSEKNVVQDVINRDLLVQRELADLLDQNFNANDVVEFVNKLKSMNILKP